MFNENKGLFLGAAGCVIVWLAVYYMMVQQRWTEAADLQREAEAKQTEWKKNFQKGIPKPDAEKQIADYNDTLKKSFDELKKIEFGTPEVLKAYSVAAAKSGDPKNYLDTLRKQTVIRAGDSPTLVLKSDRKDVGVIDILEGQSDKDSIDVPTELIRLAMVDRFMTVCKESSVPIIKRFQHRPISILPRPDEGKDDEKDTPKDNSKKKGVAEDAPDRLVQMPMTVVCAAPERVVGTLLYNLQKRSDNTHGYFCIRSFQVLVKDTSSGTVDIALTLCGLLNEKYVRSELKIPLPQQAGDEERGPGSKEIDPSRY